MMMMYPTTFQLLSWRRQQRMTYLVLVMVILSTLSLNNNHNKNMVMVYGFSSSSSLLSSSTSTTSLSLSTSSLPNNNNNNNNEVLLEQRRNRLSQAISSVTKKLTYSPELVLPEPMDWTAIALQTHAITGLSKQLRHAKANVIVLQASITALQTMTSEQATVLPGTFPESVPIVYTIPSSSSSDNDNDKENDDNDKNPKNDLFTTQWNEISQAGADGVLISVQSSDLLSSSSSESSSESSSSSWIEQCQTAMKCGLQPIPELLINNNNNQDTNDSYPSPISHCVNEICTALGFDPVAMVVTTTSLLTDGEEKDET